MAALTGNVLYRSGTVGERLVLFQINNADTADTIDVAAEFTEVESATFLPSGPLTTIGAAAAVGTVITLTLATMADDDVFLLVKGQ